MLHKATETLPKHKLKATVENGGEPVVLFACGCFSPLTYLHLRLFEQARDHLNSLGRYQVLGGYFSPTNDNYPKKDLASAMHRVNMCELACDSSDWIMVNPWEARQSQWQTTLSVLTQADEQLNSQKKTGDKRIRVMLLAGSDLVESFKTPNLWAEEDLKNIVSTFGLCIIERATSQMETFIFEDDLLYEHRFNIHVIRQYVINDVSSTRVRNLIRRRMSYRYLLPDPVAEYIQQNGLYL